MLTNKEKYQIRDTAIASLSMGKRHFFGFMRNPQKPEFVSFFGEGRVGAILKFRLSLTVDSKQFSWDEESFQGRLFIFNGTQEHNAWFILTDEQGDYWSSSLDDGVDLHIIAFIIRSDFLSSDGKLLDRHNSAIPYAVNARFSNTSTDTCAVMSMVHEENTVRLWDYEANLMMRKVSCDKEHAEEVHINAGQPYWKDNGIQ